ncbi:ShlB/FhaC/HecB family hemolysin secretion/activation protein [Arthrospira platensis]|uniref:ShlB/FhaC/HecB family hemolysin secretion/activation protein n=1 Tax=Limnospira TaxID=2596745 RepID=UPI0025708302|nr:ShlB/FhaC/HecB family hemolysin secretion/activation protein [Limnospira sp. PMC 289.06]MDT9296293.1 ShlB/FhaC/HecB family hemolysin secretion/activation protein [Arthrospira platensis PCC 7345]MDT9309765.1 ShlB/FhaC/HecB family hemolysin secretion/activation protein [Limnospira sp. Paracas R14]
MPSLPERPQPEPELPPQLPTPEQLFPSPNLTPENIEEPPDVSITIIVEKFSFEGNTAFSDQQLAEVTQSFLNRPITFAELLQARSAITNLYISEGYITSGAFIPPQELQEGTVTIQILEGEVTDINVSATGRLNPDYVRSRLAVATAKPLNQNRLLAALQLLQLSPIIDTIQAELSAGTRPGQSILDVEFTTAKTFDINLFANNYRPPSVSTFQRGVELTEANLLGQGDSLGIYYSNTDGSNVVDVLYDFPINSRNGTVGFYFNYTDSNIVEPPFKELDIEATSVTFELRYRQPIIQTPTEELALGVSFARRESETSILGIGFPLARGADSDGKTRLSILRLSQEYTRRGTQQVLAARSQFSIGLNLFNSTINDDGPDSQYLAWRGQAQWLRLLAPDTLVLLRSDIQLSTQELVPLEQAGLGGLDNLRGYRQDALLRDNFIFASAELRYPILRVDNNKGILQVTPFVDFGTAWSSNADQLQLSSETLMSLGLGLRWQYGDNFRARFDWGIPLMELSSNKRTLQEQGLYFSVEWSPFR